LLPLATGFWLPAKHEAVDFCPLFKYLPEASSRLPVANTE